MHVLCDYYSVTSYLNGIANILVMFNYKVTSNEIKLDGKTLKEVEEYIYLGQRITLKKIPWRRNKKRYKDRLGDIWYK